MEDDARKALEDISDIDSTSVDSSAEASLSNDGEDEISILGEIVGARHLTVRDESRESDVNSEDLRPYCMVKFGQTLVHKSKAASDKGCNPIWTATTGSLFVIKAKPSDMINKRLSIDVMSKRDRTLTERLTSSSSLFLGQIHMDASTLLNHCDQQRFEVDLKDEMGKHAGLLGSIALRFRAATPSDQQIVRLLNPNSKISTTEAHSVMKNLVLESNPEGMFQESARPRAKLVTETAETEVAQTSFFNALSSVWTSSRVIDRETGSEKVKVKPYPDPEREEDTKFLSKQDLFLETKSASQNWVEAGSGTLGKLYCEILACHDLPNVDIGEAVGNVTDSFVCLVYEDTCAMTEVIDDELSPHWLPWTQRAFCFGMMHPASILYLGVFDYDLGTTHEPLGRIAVNVSNLQRNTVHTLKYNLYPSSNVTDRTATGSITIRLRIECPDEKKALLVALQPRPKIFVNVEKEKSFKVVRYTCFGEYDGEEKFDLTVTRSYVNEIFAYKAAIGYTIADTMESLIYWRGQVRIFNIMVPIHSFFFFCMATDLIERPHMIVAYTLLCIAWIMLATLTVRRQHPSPWHTSPSFSHFLHILMTGKSPTPVSTIQQHENETEAIAYEKEWYDRLSRDQRLAAERLKMQQELNEIGDDNISTKMAQSAIPFDLLARLARWQGIAGRYCGYMRFMKIILTWEESFVSFWITAGFLASGLVAMMLPWQFLLTWTSRILVWGCLGPHMKIVDLYLRANTKADEKLKRLANNFDVQSNMARLRREEAVKAKEIKAIAFGNYSIQVPSYNIARHFDRPLAESSARLCRKMPKRSGNHKRVSVVNLNQSPWIPGQQLFGVMIPRPEHEHCVFEDEFRRQEKTLERFKDKVTGIRNAKRGGLYRRFSASKKPESLGYEVISENVSEKRSFETAESNDDSERDRISIVPTWDEDDESGSTATGKVVLESDGKHLYEVKAKPIPIPEEQGLEIVGLGRYSTLAKDANEDENDILMTRSSDAVLEKNESKLSSMFKSSEEVEVAFYRPLENIKSAQPHVVAQ